MFCPHRKPLRSRQGDGGVTCCLAHLFHDVHLTTHQHHISPAAGRTRQPPKKRRASPQYVLVKRLSLSVRLVCGVDDAKQRAACGSSYPLSLSSLTASWRLTTLIVLMPRYLAYEISSCPKTLVAAFCSSLHMRSHQIIRRCVPLSISDLSYASGHVWQVAAQRRSLPLRMTFTSAGCYAQVTRSRCECQEFCISWALTHQESIGGISSSTIPTTAS